MLRQRSDIRCLVVLSAKAKSFCHGADISMIRALGNDVPGGRQQREVAQRKAQEGARFGQRLFSAWEALPFPTVAALRGVCVGGGMELALSCTYRVAAENSLRLGLPEVRLGILPAWGCTVRLPRRIGLAEALQLMLTGKSVDAPRARRLGLVDELVPTAGFLRHVHRFARAVMAGQIEAAAELDLREMLQDNPLGRRIVFDQARRRTLAKTDGRYPAPARTIEVVKVGLEQGKEAGLEAEARALGELATGTVAANLQHVFQLHQRAKDQPPSNVHLSRIAVVGAGVMGSEIAQLVAIQGGLPVRLLDTDPESSIAALRNASRVLHNRVKRRRLSRTESRAALTRLQPCLDTTGFHGVDLVVEAITENLESKRRLLQRLEEEVRPNTVFATNTSSLSVNDLARGLRHPQRLVGLHFFNPPGRLPLVELVAGEKTSPASLEIARAFALRLGKRPVAVKDSPGFLVNRILSFAMTEALCLLAEGYRIDDIDHALESWGLPMGPLALIDRVGIDLAIDVVTTLQRAFPGRFALPPWELEEIFLQRRWLGTKTGIGYYRCEEGRRTPNSDLYPLLDSGQRRSLKEPLVACDRVTLPMVNEAARCLVERVVSCPEDIDFALLTGAGFPPFRGGLCRWADEQGIDEIVRVLERLAQSVGPRFAPSAALRQLADAGGFYSYSQETSST